MPAILAKSADQHRILRGITLVQRQNCRNLFAVKPSQKSADRGPTIVTANFAGIDASDGRVERHPDVTLFSINGDFTAPLIMVRASETSAVYQGGNIRFDRSLKPDMASFSRMDWVNQRSLDYLTAQPRHNLPPDAAA